MIRRDGVSGILSIFLCAFQHHVDTVYCFYEGIPGTSRSSTAAALAAAGPLHARQPGQCTPVSGATFTQLLSGSQRRNLMLQTQGGLMQIGIRGFGGIETVS